MELAVPSARSYFFCSEFRLQHSVNRPLFSQQRMYSHGPQLHRLRFSEERPVRHSSRTTITCKCQASSPGVSGLSAPTEASDEVKPTSNDLLVIGPGVLGRLIAGLWMKDHPGCKVVGQTNTTTHHIELLALGIKPIVKGLEDARRYPYVVFCAPPSGSTDYPAELRSAAMKWDATGAFLFTSSSGVYDCGDNGYCDEECPVVPFGTSPRLDDLLKAESEVLTAGGNVLRLAGLYSLDRGPHTFWARKASIDSRPDYLLNLLHYEDAATLSLAILKKGFRSQIFLGCDNHPLSRQDVMDIVIKSGKLDVGFKGFTGTDGPLGKKMNCSKTQEITGWQPKYNSFAEFFGVPS